MNKLEALLKACFWIFMAYTFVIADYRNPMFIGKLFVLLAIICCTIGIWAIYRDYKKDVLAVI